MGVTNYNRVAEFLNGVQLSTWRYDRDMMEAQRSNEATIDMMEAQRSDEPLKDSGKLKLSIVCLYDTCNIISSLSVQHQCRYFFNIHTQTLKLKSLGGVLLVSSQSEAVSTAD